METPTICILLADRHSLFREALAGVLSGEPDFRIVCLAKDGLEAVAQIEGTPPDVAVVESALVNDDGIRTAEVIRDMAPGCRVIVLADREDDESLVEAMEAGASGFMTKEASVSSLGEAVRSVYRGETVIPPHMLGALLRTLAERRTHDHEARLRFERLTRRERQVLAMLARGADNHAIARVLVISPQTARTHIQNVLPKLEVHSRLEAAAFATKHRILDDLEELQAVNA